MRFPVVASAVVLFFSVSCVATLFAEEPEALTKARQKYVAKLKAATDPITAEYLVYLEKLMKKFGGDGDLDAAQAVKAEILSLRDSDAIAKLKTANQFVGKWFWNNQTHEIRDDGKFLINGRIESTWMLKGKDCQLYWRNGSIDTLSMTKDSHVANGRNKTGDTWTAFKIY